MRVLFITKGDFIDKQNEGGLACRYRNYYLLQKTAGKNNVYVCAVVPYKKENKENIKYIYDKQTLVSRYINYLGMRDGISKRTEQEIVDYISEINPDYIFYDGSTWGNIAEKINDKENTIVFFHNIERQYTLERVKKGNILCLLRYWATCKCERKQIENVEKYNVPCVVTLNQFVTDTEAELEYVKRFCEERGCRFALSQVWEKGGEGGIELAKKVVETVETEESHFQCLYEDSLSLREKMETVAKEIYGAREVIYDKVVQTQIDHLEALGFGTMPVCMAKNQYSLSDDPTLLGRPRDFSIHIRDVYVSAGAGFVVAITGTVMTMPGLPKVPAAERIDVDEDGKITGLF